jgi:hypothetical protein
MENTLTSQQTLRPEDELQYIRKIIADSRAAFVEDGKPYIVWGLLVAIGMTITYISALTNHDLYTGFIWIGLTLLGYAYIIYYVRKKRKQEPRVRNVLDRIQGSIWGACGGTIGLVIIIIMGNSTVNGTWIIAPLLLCFIVSAILGIAYFLSGVVNDLKWLRNVGFAWWAGSIIMCFWQSVHVLGLYALMMVLFQVIPGIILQRRYKRITSETTEA